MNKIFAIIFSLHLILAPVAMAQGSGDQFRDGDSSQGGGAGFYASQILGLTTGVLGSSILTTCKLGWTQPSIVIFMGGALTHIIGEIAGGKAQNNFHNAKLSNLKMVEEKLKQGGDLQKEVLETALKDEKETRDFIKKRKNWMIAVSTIYTAAAVMAMIEFILSLPPPPAGVGILKPAAGGCFAGPLMGQPWSTLLIGAFSMLSPKGGSGAVSQYGGMAVAIGMMVPSVGAVVSNLYSMPIPRSISFGVSSALAITITSGLARRQKVAEENIEKMEKVVAQFKNETAPTTEIVENLPGSDENDPTKDKEYDYKKLAQGTVPKTCVSNGAGGMEYSESSCSKVYKIPKANINFDMVMPNLHSANNLAHDMAQAVASGDLDKADLAASGLAALASRLKDDKAIVLGKLNDQLKASGKSPLNFDKSVADQISSMQSSLNNTAGSQMASLNALEKAQVSGTTAPTNSAATTITTAKAPEAPAMDMGMSTRPAIEQMPVETSAPTASLDESLNQYESTAEDISKKSDVSLFKQVSNRYLLNYTKIFKEKKRIEGDGP